MTLPENCEGEGCRSRHCELHYMDAPLRLAREADGEIYLSGFAFRIALTGPETPNADELPQRNYLD